MDDTEEVSARESRQEAPPGTDSAHVPRDYKYKYKYKYEKDKADKNKGDEDDEEGGQDGAVLEGLKLGGRWVRALSSILTVNAWISHHSKSAPTKTATIRKPTPIN